MRSASVDCVSTVIKGRTALARLTFTHQLPDDRAHEASCILVELEPVTVGQITLHDGFHEFICFGPFRELKCVLVVVLKEDKEHSPEIALKHGAVDDAAANPLQGLKSEAELTGDALGGEPSLTEAS